MLNPRHLLVSLLLGLLTVSLLFGCRAWQPEAVVVNRPPNIYIIGSPAETSGAYFHFHVFWYGTDDDGYVERYVWALTDTSIQDRRTDDDEEDQRFNPATNISTLEIGRWTTRTDTVFDFRLNQGAELNYKMTLHMVAVDDRGAFSRKPARLTFFSNAFGNPTLDFYRGEIADGRRFANYDTVGFGRPLLIRWSGNTPNLQGYDPVRLAEIDTVNPPGQDPDGLLGYKWRLPQHDGCNAAVEDCWQPRRFNEATGDSFSYFGGLNGLLLRNDGSSPSLFDRRYETGILELLVNTIDVAGVEVAPAGRALNIIVNYDPDTYILRGEYDPYNVETHPDGRRIVYPYYEIFHGPHQGIYEFNEGQTIPDRAYVVFKALGWEQKDAEGQPRDLLLTNSAMTFQGEYYASQFFRGGTSYFTIPSPRSRLHQTPEWTAAIATEVSADTLGFQVGPFDYEFVMMSVDEHLRRDGTPDTFRFTANFPPCVQCIEVGNLSLQPVANSLDMECDDSDCLAGAPQMVIYSASDPRYLGNTTDPNILTFGFEENTFIYVNLNSNLVALDLAEDQQEGWEAIPSLQYRFAVHLHGKDDDRERWRDADRFMNRIAAWRYQINYEGDARNVLKDGGGADDLQFLSSFPLSENVPDPAASSLFIRPDSGVWTVIAKVAVPQQLMQLGRPIYWRLLLAQYCQAPDCQVQLPGNTHADTLAWQSQRGVQDAYTIFRATTMQLSPGWIDAIAADQSLAEHRPLTNCYATYEFMRMPTGLSNPRNCGPEPLPAGFATRRKDDLFNYNRYSDDGEPVRKDFSIVLYRENSTVPIVGNLDPPNWIPDRKSARIWR